MNWILHLIFWYCHLLFILKFFHAIFQIFVWLKIRLHLNNLYFWVYYYLIITLCILYIIKNTFHSLPAFIFLNYELHSCFNFHLVIILFLIVCKLIYVKIENLYFYYLVHFRKFVLMFIIFFITFWILLLIY